MNDRILREAAENAIHGTQVMAGAAKHLETLDTLFKDTVINWTRIDSPAGTESYQGQSGHYVMVIMRYRTPGGRAAHAGTCVASGHLIINLTPVLAELAFQNMERSRDRNQTSRAE